MTTMHAIDQWRQARVQSKNRIISFSQALLAPHPFFYMIYRLRYFVILNLFNIGLHVIQFYFLLLVFHSKQLREIILVSALASILIAGWWGALEVFRNQIRTLGNYGDEVKLATLKGQWLTLAFIFTFFCWITAIVVAVVAIYQSSEARLMYTFISIIIFSLGLQFIVYAYRSGIFALHRIRRTISSLVFPPLLGIFCLLIGWKFIGAYTLVVSAGLVALVNFAYGMYFIQNALLFYKKSALIWPGLTQFLAFLRSIINVNLFLASAANIFISLEGLLLWAIFFTSKTISVYGLFFLFFYLINPLSQACSNWTRLFYFDNVKYDNNVLHELVHGFNKKILWLTPLLSFFFWSLATIISISFFRRDAYLFSFLLFFFFTLRAGVSYLQIVAFSKQYYLDVIVSGILVLTAVVAMLLDISLFIHLCIILIFLVTSFLYILKPRFKKFSSSATENQLPYPLWLKKLMVSQNPVQILRLQVKDDFHAQQREALLNHLDTALKNFNWLWLDQQILLGYGQMDNMELPKLIAELSIKTGGVIQAYDTIPSSKNGYEALKLAYKNRMFESINLQKLPTKMVVRTTNEIEILISEFNRLFPYGCINWLGDPHFSSFAKKFFSDDSNFYINLLSQLYFSFVSPCNTSRDKEISVSSAVTVGDKSLIFVIPLSYENHLSALQWKVSSFLWMIEYFLQKYPGKN